MTVLPSTGTPQEVTLNSPCCEIKVPVKWVPPFRCVDVPILVDKNGNGKLDVVNYVHNANPADPDDPTEFFPDFEGYARAFLGSCYNATTFYNTYMEGWPEGTFNLMVYHMLTDKYKCDNSYSGTKGTPIQDSVQAAKGKIYNDCGEEIGEYTANGITPGCDNGNCPQYRCEDLFNCWTSQLAMLKARLCMNTGIDDQSPYNVSSGFDNESGDPKEHDDQFDKNMGGGFFLMRWIAKAAVSKRMRDLQASSSPNSIQPEYKQHLVQDFLNCTGYRFAKILTPYDPVPLPADQGPGVSYNVPADGYNFGNTSDWNDAKKSNGDYYYQPFEDWKPGVRSGATNPNTIDSKGFFPNIKNPIYAFKYFEYAFEADSNYQDLEALTCYSDPNDCYLTFDGENAPVKIPCCVTINTDGSYNFASCYFDTEYPNLDSLPLDDNYGKPTSGVIIQNGVKGKLVVNNFCDGGRMQCLYTKDYWSCGERNAFYLALKSYQIPDPSYYVVFERDCDFMKTPFKWYNNLNAETNGFPDIVSESEKNYLGSSHSFTGPIDMLHLDGSVNNNPVSVLDNELAKMKFGCLKKCEERRTEFEKMLRDTLLSKCYVIGGCKTSEDDNIIPEADFQAMVDELVNTCGSLCNVNTYTCLAPQVCRRLKTSKRITGTNLSVNPLYLGSGGGSVSGSADNCPLVSGQGYYDCSGDNTTSFCQYTKYLQATTWHMEIEFPSMCPGSEPPKFTCAPGGDTCVDKDSYVSKPGEPVESVVSGAIQVNVQVNE
jgi:hypothetical protein